MSGINIRNYLEKRTESRKSPGKFDLEKLLSAEIRLFPVRFSDKNKEAFYLELSTLLGAGLDIKSSLELLEQEQMKPVHREIICGIKESLIAGSSLWESLQNSKHFTPYEYHSIQIGEETGKIGAVLDQLYQFYHAKLKQQRQFISALSYPVIILGTSVGAVAFMLIFIVPMFSDVFKRFGGELPYLTRLIMQFSETIKAYVWLLIVFLAAAGLFIHRNKRKQWMRKYSSSVVKRIPVLGKIVYSMHMARFCRSMALLLGSRVPMIRSIDLVGQMVTFYPIQTTLPSISDAIMNGKSLHLSMAEFTVFTRKMVSLVKVGEEVNKLDVFFDKLSAQYSADVEHQTSLLNTFLEPAMIIFLGFVVGFILLAMYLPMFQISTSIGG